MSLGTGTRLGPYEIIFRPSVPAAWGRSPVHVTRGSDEIAAAIGSELKEQFAATPAARARRQPDLQVYAALQS